MIDSIEIAPTATQSAPLQEGASAAPRALEGVRVLDLGIITAGAASSQVFADFGADVIKVEATTYIDPFRNWTQVSAGGTKDINASPAFNAVNRGKRGVAIDLKTDAGRELFLRLVSVSDIVVENFRRGVLERLGIGFDRLKQANPRIVLLSLSSQGSTGPERDYVSFGSTLEAIGGVMSITGYDASTPMWTGNNVNYPDQLVSIVAPGLALAALRLRDHTGEGVHVDHSQREAVTSAIGEEIVRSSRANRPAPPSALRGVVPARGDDQWVAFSVSTDAEWIALCSVLELPVAPDDTRFAHAADRLAHRTELDELLRAACATRDKRGLAAALESAGVPAAAVQRPDEVLADSGLHDVEFFRGIPGDPHLHRGFVGRLERTPAEVGRSAPRLGQHTGEVLHEILGLNESELAALSASGAIYSDRPVAVSHPTPPSQPADGTTLRKAGQ